MRDSIARSMARLWPFSASSDSDEDIDEQTQQQQQAVFFMTGTTTYDGSSNSNSNRTTYKYNLGDLNQGSSSSVSSHNPSEMAITSLLGEPRRPFFSRLVHGVQRLTRHDYCWGRSDGGDEIDDENGAFVSCDMMIMEDVQEVTPDPEVHNAAVARKTMVVMPTVDKKNQAQVEFDSKKSIFSPDRNNSTKNSINNSTSHRETCPELWIIRVWPPQPHSRTLCFDLHREPHHGAALRLYGSEVLEMVESILNADPGDDDDEVIFQVWTYYSIWQRHPQMVFVHSDCILGHLAATIGIAAAAVDNHPQYSSFRIPGRKHHNLRCKQQQLLAA